MYIRFNAFAEHVKTGLVKVEGLHKGSEKVFFHCKDGTVIKMFHDQDCCETVYVEDLDNDQDIFTDTNFCEVEESTNSGCNEAFDPYGHNSYTWTFYRFRTNKGYLTLSWYGSSNGYYRESVDFEIVK